MLLLQLLLLASCFCFCLLLLASASAATATTAATCFYFCTCFLLLASTSAATTATAAATLNDNYTHASAATTLNCLGHKPCTKIQFVPPCSVEDSVLFMQYKLWQLQS